MHKLITVAMIVLSSSLGAADYIIDSQGAHASINFKIRHLGYSWVTGRFNTFEGKFTYDKDNITASSVQVNVDVSSIDTNHAERDKHLRSTDFLDSSTFTTAQFVSTGIEDAGQGNYNIMGNLTLHGISKPITLTASLVGEGKDPWGGYRAGFMGSTTLHLDDFGIPQSLGPRSADVLLELHIEGIRQ